MHKGTSGIKTCIFFVLLSIALIFGIYKLTTTDLFSMNRSVVVKEAAEASIVDFQKSCLIYTEQELRDGDKELKDKPIYYYGTIKNIEESPFGDSTVTIVVGGNKYKMGENTRVQVKIADSAYLRANEGDKVEVFGKFDTVKDSGAKTIIKVDGVRIIKAD